MTPIRFKVTEKEDASFHIQINEKPYQYDYLHYHPEYQLSLIVKGKGVLSIGDSVETFNAGDIYLIAPNVPHVFKNESVYFETPKAAQSHMVSIFFLTHSFGGGFLQLPEMVKINDFLRETTRGVKLNPPLAKELKLLIFDLVESNGAQRIISLLQLLNIIALSKDKQFISNVPYTPQITTTDSTMSRIFNYIAKNFDQPISLEEVSKIAHLNKYAFCRYFKKITHKSFIVYLNEFRVSMACKFLLKETYSISQVGFLFGYNNISNFYKQFK